MNEIIANLLCENGPMTAEEIQTTVARMAQQALAAMVAKGQLAEVITPDGVAYDVEA